MSLQNDLNTKRTMLDVLQGNLKSIKEAQYFKKKPDDDWRMKQIQDNIERCRNEIYELEKEIIAKRRK